MAETTTKKHTEALNEARSAVTTLRTLQPFLSEADKETLSTLIDKELIGTLKKSLQEEREGKVEPLESILS
jgi:hypothetical protein